MGLVYCCVCKYPLRRWLLYRGCYWDILSPANRTRINLCITINCMNTLKQERNKKVHCIHFIIFISKQDNKMSLQNHFGD